MNVASVKRVTDIMGEIASALWTEQRHRTGQQHHPNGRRDQQTRPGGAGRAAADPESGDQLTTDGPSA